MRLLAFSGRTAKEILRDPLNLFFGLGFPLVLIGLLTAIQANIPVPMFELDNLTPGITVFGLSFMTLFAAVLISKDLLYAEVLRENTYLSRTIEVQENQKVIDTGLYGIVRHPMYSVTIILFLTMPLMLGSILSFVVFLFYPLIIAKRIKNEEQVLETELDGYADYKKKVKYRLIPYIW